MAAYAALVSLKHIIDNLQNHHRPPISLHKQQVHLLTQKLTSLLQFLEIYNPRLHYTKEADPLETRIARAAYAAEDAIESHILDQYTNSKAEKMNSDGLYEALEKAIEDMALVEEEAMEIKETGVFRNKLFAKPTPLADSSASSIARKKRKSKMVGADDILLEMKSKLTSDARDLQVITVVGMGGSGKTSLAFHIYEDGLIQEHFDIRAWVTISQEYSILEILRQLLTQIVRETGRESSEGELGEMLHKHLYGRKYMIILDDMWSLEAWDGVGRFLPNNKNGSRVVVTTRLTTLALTLSNSNSLGMKLLDEDDSWDLLSKTVFWENGFCPPELEAIGKKIGKSCKGLPLSIVVVGGLLSKFEQSIESWEHMQENLNSIVNLEDDERCLKIFHMSYKQLPVHLKPCFLYMGIYPEDHVIRVLELTKLWVAEGFLMPVSGKRLEDVARAYLKDLIDRNLILMHKVGSIGSVKECRVHDLLRDFILREAKKEEFYSVYPGHEIRNGMSRIVRSGGTIPEVDEVDTLSTSPLARSLIVDLSDHSLPSHISRRLRIVNGDCFVSRKIIENEHQLVNSRFYASGVFSTLIWQFWNLQTFSIMKSGGLPAPTYIWHMSNIRHLIFNYIFLPNPPSNVQDGVVLANLQTLGRICGGFTWSEQMVKRIPNIRKLEMLYSEDFDDSICLTNLERLDKLESLCCIFHHPMCRINYPQSLKKLSLSIPGSQCWQDILDKIGELPLLQKLTLLYGTFKGQWETTQGQFCNLKYLCIDGCRGLQVWTTEASHFPRLEQLHLYHLYDHPEEIPLDFADISTLGLICMVRCSDSAMESAERILEEQEALYGEEETTLQIQVKLSMVNNPELASLRSRPNFHVARNTGEFKRALPSANSRRLNEAEAIGEPSEEETKLYVHSRNVARSFHIKVSSSCEDEEELS